MALTKDIEGTYAVESFGSGGDYSHVKLHFRNVEGETVNFNTRVANQIQGTLNLKEGKLEGLLISTMMMGPEHLMALEAFLTGGSTEGLSFSTTATGLSLEYKGSTLVLKKE
ncbi:hypothetical protein STCU_10416 [Strigomonas culicis]|uniref:DUF306 domain-containing protein n=1 Tax=Strigomonas culicis TaxID=28005 RepID=S9TI57_9TRYP|nr:hypothetical protein STCU_10416 [Strigomonas culicis]|eukprot:EPY17757.1 hypothetical protein STCU_10416 [Strigomonas culicis]